MAAPTSDYGNSEKAAGGVIDYKENDKVRITRNGSFASAGLLEVFHDGEWGTVCDDRFGDVNAGIVCRMLGYATGTAHIKAAFGQGSGRIWLDNVFCRGDELSIFDCPANPIGDEDCEHDEDIGVSCTGTATDTCIDEEEGCERWSKRNGACIAYEHLIKNCRKTCGYCAVVN